MTSVVLRRSLALWVRASALSACFACFLACSGDDGSGDASDVDPASTTGDPSPTPGATTGDDAATGTPGLGHDGSAGPSPDGSIAPSDDAGADGSTVVIPPGGFQHPGVLVNGAQLAFVKQKIEA